MLRRRGSGRLFFYQVRKMNKQETYRFLKEHGISCEITEHKAVFNMEELDSVELPYPEWDAKNLFVRDDKKRNYYLIAVKGDKRVDLKAFRKAQGLRPRCFASAGELMACLWLIPRSGSPLGVLKDPAPRVRVFLDTEFLGNRIGVHPCDNTATVWLQAEDLMRLIREHGNEADWVTL